MHALRIWVFVLALALVPHLVAAQSWSVGSIYGVSGGEVRRVVAGALVSPRSVDVLAVTDVGLLLLRSDGNGGVISPSVLLRGGAVDVTVGKFFGGSSDDLAVIGTNEAGQTGLYLLKNLNGGEFGDNVLVSVPALHLDNSCRIVEGAFSGKEGVDLAIACSSQPGVLAVGVNDGKGHFIFSAISVEPGRAIGSMAAGDFDGDGLEDLAVVSYGPEGTGRGDVIWSIASQHSVVAAGVLPDDVREVVAGDYDGGLREGLAALSYRAVQVFGVDSARVFTKLQTMGLSPSWKIRSLGAAALQRTRSHPSVMALDLLASGQCEDAAGKSIACVGVLPNTAATVISIVPARKRNQDGSYSFTLTVKALHGDAVPSGEVLVGAGKGASKKVHLTGGQAAFHIHLPRGLQTVAGVYRGGEGFAASATKIRMVVSAPSEGDESVPRFSGTASLRKRHTSRSGQSITAEYRKTDKPRFLLIDTGYPVLLGGIGVSPGTAIPYGTAFTFAAFAESTIPGEYAGWFTCGTNFASECYPGIGWEIPSGAPAWTIDGVSVGEGDMYFEYDSYECATDDNDEPMYCDAVTENLTYSAALSPGTHTVTVQWAQTSDPDSNSVVQSTTVTVTKANPSVLLSANPANMNYGSLATFTAAINGGANPTGTVTFEINGATFGTATVNNGVAIYNGTNESWPIGTYTISAVYSGDGSNNGAAGTVSETVSKAAPTITWSTPAAIFYGTALSASQLNATSSVPGTFVYSPATGTVLTAGTQILSVTFIPTDTTDYNTATGTVTLTMNKAALTVTPNPDSKTYGTANPMFTGTVTGLFVGDPITVAYSSGATAFTPAGIYSAGANAIAATLSDPTGRLGNYTLMQSLGTLTITQSGTAISITSSQNPSTYGDNVTFTFDFSGTGVPPTGTATLTEGATVLATLTLNSSGVATYTSSTLSAGTHTLKSTYNGDSNYY